MPLSPGAKLGPYEIVAPIGAGGMGEVYRARDTRLGRDVAVKILPAAFASDTDRMRRFEQEARAVAALNHPNVLSVFDIGSQDGMPYLVSELLGVTAFASYSTEVQFQRAKPWNMGSKSPTDSRQRMKRESFIAI